MQFPPEILDIIISYVGSPECSPWGPQVNCAWRYEVDIQGRQHLSTARLVSKAFSRSACPWLFQHVVASHPGGVGSSSKPLDRLRDISLSRHAQHVRQLDLGVTDCAGSHDAACVQYIQSLTQHLTMILMRLPKLSALKFVYRSRRTPPRLLRLSLMAPFISVLRYVDLPHLEELDVTFPTAYDFGALLQDRGRDGYDVSSAWSIPVSALLRRLRHLGLHVRESTSQQARFDWQDPVSPEDAAFPNEEHAGSLLKLVEMSKSISSLAISSPDPLPIDGISLAQSVQLENLHLYCVRVSAESMSEVMHRCGYAIASIQLERVELSSGTWDQVLMDANRQPLPRLTEFYVQACGYPEMGPASRWRPAHPRPHETVAIDTLNDADMRALGILQRQVLANRRALGLSRILDYVECAQDGSI